MNDLGEREENRQKEERERQEQQLDEKFLKEKQLTKEKGETNSEEPSLAVGLSDLAHSELAGAVRRLPLPPVPPVASAALPPRSPLRLAAAPTRTERALAHRTVCGRGRCHHSAPLVLHRVLSTARRIDAKFQFLTSFTSTLFHFLSIIMLSYENLTKQPTLVLEGIQIGRPAEEGIQVQV
ncbi:hypothetical protein BLNAU_1150 [Blattamonas nauphoetae]|uniref:Uncharacterized protein n=1 Tax=Blattamonas nauphoetae TaxID=2049346 RepID=A0ABQ9YKH1_9EUKA|nr:hypothetical protein BLNAU_1150 [Blattamonas nauphoetae]